MSRRHIIERYITAQDNWLAMAHRVEAYTKELENRDISEDDLRNFYEPQLKALADQIDLYRDEYKRWVVVLAELDKPNVNVRGKSRNRIEKYSAQNKALMDFVAKQDKETEEKLKVAKAKFEELLKSGELK